MIARLCFTGLVSVLLSAQEPAPRDANVYNKEKEAALGTSLASEVRKHTSTIGDSKVYDYIGALGRQLAAHMPDGDFDWEFVVIRDDLGREHLKLFPFPVDTFLYRRPLILAVDSEAELAGMLAHSMAHIAERHGRRMATRGQVTNLSSIPLVYHRRWDGDGCCRKR